MLLQVGFVLFNSVLMLRAPSLIYFLSASGLLCVGLYSVQCIKYNAGIVFLNNMDKLCPRNEVTLLGGEAGLASYSPGPYV